MEMSKPVGNTIGKGEIARIVLHRSCSLKTDLSYMTHYFPLLWEKVAMEKMAIINTFGPVSINGWSIGYMLADHSLMNRTR